jgi:hypothetical protein
MRLKKMITSLHFDGAAVSRYALGAGTRVDGQRRRLELSKEGASYPAGAIFVAKTRLVRPSTMKGLLGFEAVSANYNVDLVDVTSVRFRLSTNGTDELFWDGGGWSTAATGEWNTEAEVADNIASFPVTNRGFQVIVGLQTSHGDFSPAVYQVKVLWTSDIDFLEDYLERSFIRSLSANMEVIGDYLARFQTAVTSVTLSVPTVYDMIGVDSAFDVTDDPDMLDDISVSWDAPSRTLQLSRSVPAGHKVFVRFLYRPTVALTTSQHYTEVAKLPGVQLESVSVSNRTKIPGSGESVLNKRAGVGWRLEGGHHADIVITLRAVTDKEKDAQRISGVLQDYFESAKYLRSVGLDEEFDLVLDRPYDHATVPTQDGLHGGRVTVRIVRAVFYPLDAVPVYGATKPITFGGGGNLGG